MIYYRKKMIFLSLDNEFTQLFKLQKKHIINNNYVL
jgi:hypothetical protein